MTNRTNRTNRRPLPSPFAGAAYTDALYGCCEIYRRGGDCRHTMPRPAFDLDAVDGRPATPAFAHKEIR